MNRTNSGPFKPIAMLWFPFSVPATVLGMLLCLLFYLVNFAAVPFVDGLHEPADALRLFGKQCANLFTRLRLIDGAPGGLALFLVQIIAALGLWSTIGLGICRCVALRLCRDEYVGLKDALSFGLANAKTTALFPVIVLASVSVLAAVNLLLGSLMQIPYLGVVFYLLLPLAFVMTALMLIIAFTSVVGIGMVPGAVAVEQRGTLDAWGKALNYIFARPLHVIIYIVLMKVFLVDIVIGFGFESSILHEWTFASLSPFWENEGFDATLQSVDNVEGIAYFAALVAQFVVSFVNLAIAGLVTSFAFAGTTAMFLILRRDVDGIDVGDIKQD